MKSASTTNPVSFRDQVAQRQLELGMTDAEVAKATNFPAKSLYRAMLQQKFPMPLGRVPQLATTLKLDPGLLLRAAMSEIVPDFLAMIDTYLRPSELTDREARLLLQFREVTRGQDPGPVVFYDCLARQTLVLDVEKVT